MSLYDDIADLPKDRTSLGSSLNPSQIKLLQDHLKLKKNQLSTSKQPTKQATHKNVPILAPIITPHLEPTSSTGSLLGGDWDITQEYDPAKPNDYEKVVREKKEAKERLRQKRLQELQMGRVTSVKPLKNFLPYSDDEEEDDRPQKRASAGAAIPPPINLITSPTVTETRIPASTVTSIAATAGVSSTAAKIMAKMGYREGQGLGINEQGISKPLQVQKVGFREGKIVSSEEDVQVMPPPPTPSSPDTSSQQITEMMKNPTKVVLLTNMVGPGEVDADLEPETKEECSKYGEVVKCTIIEDKNPTTKAEEAVKIYLEFRRIESAIKAVIDLNGRFFGGRSVKASFFDFELYKRTINKVA